MGLNGLGLAVPAILIPAMLFASWNDYRRHRVPNWLNASILLSGLLVQTATGGTDALILSIEGAAVGFGSLILFWAMRAMGAGDVKFMAAVGAWLGPAMTFQAVLIGGLLGGVLAAAMIAYQRRWAQALVNMSMVMRKVSSAKTAFGDFGSVRDLTCGGAVMPYAVPLTFGTLCVLFSVYSGWGGLQ